MIAFLAEQIESVLELEVLLLLQARAPQTWTAVELARTLKIDQAWAAELLARFAERRLLSRAPGTPPQYAYAPADPPLDETVQAVAHAYATHRVRIIGLIFSKPASNLKSFAEAFRLRREPKESKDPNENAGGME